MILVARVLKTRSEQRQTRSPVPYFEIMEEFSFGKQVTVLCLSIFFCLFEMVKVDENTCSVQPVFIMALILTLIIFLHVMFMTEFLSKAGGNFIKVL